VVVITVQEALEHLLARFSPLAVETVPLLSALGRGTAEDQRATIDLPAFDHSAMDGYALRHADVRADGVLPVRGEARAAAGGASRLESGTAMRIFTGGALPLGADTVVMQENTALEADGVRIREVPELGANVRRAGSDLRAGTVALARGTAIGPGEVGLLASLGRSEVRVHRKPSIAILPTGDELRELGSALEPGSVVNSNAYSLAAAIAGAGGEARVLPIARDRLEDVRSGLRAARGADLLLTVGGASVGDYDLVGRALGEEGFSIAFHKVAIKPGKPILFGVSEALPVIGLPGNPVSAFVTFEIFVRPCIHRMRGLSRVCSELVPVKLAAATRHSRGRLEFARAKLSRRGPELVATLHAKQGSGSLPSITNTDALVLLPADQGEFEAGADLFALPLGVPMRETPPFATSALSRQTHA
jgi:molybdopterin molybdotransferase